MLDNLEYKLVLQKMDGTLDKVSHLAIATVV